MTLPIPLLVRYILTKLERAGFEAYLVGGAVRDLLLNRPTADWDVTTNAKPEDIMKVFKHHFYTNAFGTVGLPFEGLIRELRSCKVAELLSYGATESQLKEIENDLKWQGQVFDVTTYRFEFNYTDKRRPERVEWGKTLTDDLSRRDFTINALAFKLHRNEATEGQEVEGEVIDLFGGLDDINNKIIKTVGNPNERFEEDALRMMRAIRFGAQLSFSIESDTLMAIQKLAVNLNHISMERIRDELLKILKSNYPAEGMLLLYNAGLLNFIIPELLTTRQIKQGGHHIYDVWNHSLEALRGCPSSDPIVRLSTLLHDIGKPKTVRYQGPRGVTFYGHEVVGARMVAKIGERLRLEKKQVEKMITLVRWHMFAYDSDMTDAAIRRFIKRVGLENINDMILLRVGDRKGGGSKATSWRLNELQQRIGEQMYEPLSLKDLAVNGADVMEILNIQPGRKIGDILNVLFEEVIEDSSKNNKEYLIERIKQLGNPDQ